ncbi:MAG: methyltransferase domain-containing protein [Epsilonproteobacteria bacterium]|nr:methyltransferase domain-containing protein [Campylobacterota bacterium]
MNDQREFWNERFGREGYFYGTTANRYLASHIDELPPQQTILFLGEGEGRNAVYALERGHTVTALDAAEIGLAKTAQLAQSKGLELSLIHTDLEFWNPTQQYDAIMCSFLHLYEPLRSEVFGKALKHLNKGGIFVGEFFSIHQFPKTTGGPKDLNLLYTADKLSSILKALPCEILELYEIDTQLNEGLVHNGLASVVRLKVQKR